MGGVLPRPGLALSHSATALSAASCSGEKSGMGASLAGPSYLERNKNNCQRRSCSESHVTMPSRRLGLRLDCEILGKPVLDHAVHPRVAFREHEVIGVGKQMYLGRLAGMSEQLDRLIDRRDVIVGAVQEEQRPRRDLADHVIGAEVEHALRRLGW